MHRLDFLLRYPTTRIESGLNLLKIRPREQGFTQSDFVRPFPKLGRMAGYAVTSQISTDSRKPLGTREPFEYWNYVAHIEGPKVAVTLDVDSVPAIGSAFGRVSAHAAKALGCLGIVTNGGVRDADEMEGLGFHVYCKRLTIGHGTPHTVNFGTPVTLGGVLVNPGDVVCADAHGMIVFPPTALLHLEEAIEADERRVGPVLKYCLSPGFTPTGLAEVVDKHMKKAPRWEPSKGR